MNEADDVCTDTSEGKVDGQKLKLGGYQTYVDERLDYWKKTGFNRRLWQRDPTLWFSKPVSDISNRLGWLDLPERMHEQLEDIVAFAEGVRSDGFENIVLLGMGGSSLAPGVFQKIFGNARGYPELMVLDSTHPDAIRTVEARIDLKKTLFIVASKSGTTLEPNVLFKYFWEKMGKTFKARGSHFIAITDPGTPLSELAEKSGFRKTFLAYPDLGGRYSALSVFGMVPAALIGVDVQRLLDRALSAVEKCASCSSEENVPGLVLGAAIGELALRGRDKITFLTPPSITSFTGWLEQLISESTGKDGKGIIPVVGEPWLKKYGDDRIFVVYTIEGDDRLDLPSKTLGLEAEGHPVVKIHLMDLYEMGLEMYRWELVVASASAVLGVHPFNQPDVELSKDLARMVLKKRGEKTVGEEALYIDDKGVLKKRLLDWTRSVKKADYIAIQAFLVPSKKTDEGLRKIRSALSNKLGVAVTIGYGPRFLHSTGQLHKGGANNGLFLQLLDEPLKDLSVPGVDYTFGEVIRAQAIGDFRALKRLGRRIIALNLRDEVNKGLTMVNRILK